MLAAHAEDDSTIQTEDDQAPTIGEGTLNVSLGCPWQGVDALAFTDAAQFFVNTLERRTYDA
jgi:hypothetical protein